MIKYKDIEITNIVVFRQALIALGLTSGDLWEFAEANRKEPVEKVIAFLEDSAGSSMTYTDFVEKELLTVKEAMLFLGVSEATIYNWKNKGILQFWGIGNRSYLKTSEILAALTKI